MQRHPILRCAVCLCFAFNLLVFPVRSTGIIQLDLLDNPYLEELIYTALSLQSSQDNIRGALPHGSGINRLILTGRKVEPTATRVLLDLEQVAQPSAVVFDSITFLLAAPGVER